MNRKTWTNWKFRKPCPTCIDGILNIPNESKIIKSETAKSRNEHNFNSYFTDSIFSMHLICSNCGDLVSVSGIISEEDYPSNEEVGLQIFITPKTFYPAPKIITIPDSCPNSVRKLLIKSFELFWIDIGSCANKIRTSIEVLLTEQGIAITATTKNGDIQIKLHKRIEEFEISNYEVAQYLFAIKWIGNAGSHDEELVQNDILDAYELLEFGLEKLFSDREKKLKQLSDEINLTKKLRKK
jgi:hypothetical protein